MDNDLLVVPEQQFPEEPDAPMLSPSGRSKRARLVLDDANDSALNKTDVAAQPDIPDVEPMPDIDQPAVAEGKEKDDSEMNAEEDDAEGEDSVRCQQHLISTITCIVIPTRKKMFFNNTHV